MSSADSRPVIVVGNGPVGQTAALLLARWQVPVILVDGREQRDPVGSKAICQQRDVIDIWEQVGVGRLIAAEGLTWRTSRTFYRGIEIARRTIPDVGVSPFPPFVNISQARTEELLDETIASESLIDVRWAHECVGVDEIADGVSVRCATEAGEVVLTGSHAIVCAGARSDSLRTALGLTLDGRTFGDQFLICDIRADLPDWARERQFHFDPEWNPGRQVLVHPCPDSVFRIDWQVTAGFDLNHEERSGALDARIRQVIGDREYEVLWKSVYRFHSRVVDRMRVGRTLVAGDAAHLLAPFGARGLNSGVQDAENAAWKVAFVRNGWAPESLLESYHYERRSAALENLAVTGATMRFMVPQTHAERYLRNAKLERALRDPSAAAAVDSGQLAEPHVYAASPLTTPSPGPAHVGTVTTPGGLLADHPVHDGRLRELVRSGITILLGPGTDPAPAHAVAAAADAPIAVHLLNELAADLAAALGVLPGTGVVVRPDAHVAAVLDHPTHAALAEACERLLGRRLPVPA